MAESVTDVDAYICAFPDDVQLILQKIRQNFSKVVPAAGEKISYQMPTVTMDGQSLVYFAAWKQHVGMYPIPATDEPLANRILPYRGSKDTVKFVYRKPIPYDLIEQIADLLVLRRQDSELDPTT